MTAEPAGGVSLTPFDFWKMHGAGNDFVVTAVAPERLHAPDAAWSALARAVCDRHFGVGADGLLLVLPSQFAHARMRMFNPDGSEAEMCGNGIRCFVKYVLDRGLAPAPEGALLVETIPGVLAAQAAFDAAGAVSRVRVGMGAPALRPQDLGVRVERAAPVLDLPLEATGERLSLTLVSMGNPHVVQFIDGAPAAFDLARIGPAVEHHPLFAHRTNFEVVHVLDRGRVEMRVWERGAGETLACGSGACAAVVAARLHDFVGEHVEVRLPGGTLGIEWDGAGSVYLEGPATRVFAATWEHAVEGAHA